jgi:aspartokinase-like uncharacterized kinase
MHGFEALTVVKLGGSHAFAAYLQGWLDAVASCAGRIVLVPGGGPFADAVRGAQRKMGFGDRAAHHMALLAMEQYACALASLHPILALAGSMPAIRRALRGGRVPVWLPTRMVLQDESVPWSWDVTADSLAAWLAGRIGAPRLLLVKHEERSAAPAHVEDLVARGIVDPLFPRFLRGSGVEASLAGPTEQEAVVAAICSETIAGTRIDL